MQRSAVRAAFVFDPERCTGCEACRVACANENGGGVDLGWRQVVTFNPAHYPGLPTRHLSLACSHCERPACLEGCPAAAYRRDEATGAVLLDEAKCIGCRYCSWLCPYDVPRYLEASGTMTKCTFCSHRLVEGLAPACAQACPTGALAGGTRDAVRGEPSWPWGPTRPTSRALGPALVVTGGAPIPAGTLPFRPPPRKIHPRSELGLVLFTLVLPALVAWWGAGMLRPSVAPSPFALVAAGLVAMGLSALHLGRPLRSPRALLNLKSSWLSRELALSTGFLVAAGLGAPAWLVLVLGAAAVLSIDLVYRSIPQVGERAWAHSAEAWMTVPLLAGLLAGAPLLWAPAAALKLALLAGAFGSDEEGKAETMAPLFVSLRGVLLVGGCGAALAGPGGALLSPAVAPTIALALALALALSGELLDRIRFYLELEPASPLRLMYAGRTVA